MSDWVEQDKVRAMREALQAVEARRPETPVQISALALYLLAHTITFQQDEIESLMLGADDAPRNNQSAVDVSLAVELAALRHALAAVDDKEWHADGCTVRAVGDQSYVASAHDRSTVVYLAMLDPRFVRRLLAELDRLSVNRPSPA
ncbi:hypothetical protein [Paraburkholderia phenoliruptrix]|uniref:hypothetical protein n=1 Tax=Paraburkholderia phenoliruptrix TaxID=252970 RepID=UPI001C6E4487|nr:hypothetical protein [Paraburkholderia phenoliruptrix]MBW9102939.1 hypothetical protein [Paraburkholderia phenoliruptrix]MBW9132913.1 hypothetical protein [Paraburkholderia ginsengiterrae]